jgi:hypothetical protein
VAFTIHRFRMSLFWSAPFATLLADAAPVGAPLAGLGHLVSYSPVFENLLADPSTPVSLAAGAPPLELPWPPTGTHWFWCRYLNANPIRRVRGTFAFVRLVPLRRHGSPLPGLNVALPAEVASSDEAVVERLFCEAWFHPHMVTLAVHFTVDGALSPAKMAAVCLSLRHGHVFSVAQGGASDNLDTVATRCLEGLYLEAVGPANAAELAPANPFSVVTVLNVGPSALEQPVVDGDPVHCALEAVTQWQSGKVGSLAAGRISSHEPPPPLPVLFGHARARAVWDPGRSVSGRTTSIGCYHRNLFVGTLQTEALLNFASVADTLAEENRRPKAIRDCEPNVLDRIHALHVGEADTYRSVSLKRFIDDHPLRPSVNNMANRRRITNKELPPLATPPPPGAQPPSGTPPKR